MIPPLVPSTRLAALLADAVQRPLLVDCSFDLADPEAGPWAYAAAHLPGAVYLHLENDLSGPRSGANGRHPLPQPEHFVATMAALGADDERYVVAYDNAAGMYAARLWWMLRWVGHAAASVLDGGSAAWRAAGLPVEAGAAAATAVRGDFSRRSTLTHSVARAALAAQLAQGRCLVVDARSAERFRGENETLDPVAGHIPGAINRHFKDNLRADGTFKPPDQLRAEWLALLGGRAVSCVVSQCGSGVTACHNLLALEVAGLHGAALYPGSWSEWCALPGAPVAVGAAP
ncbi:MAG: sulfurtransferase [Gammaproteobacteria bacterium]|nr:sulfurtransferase [Gammaproteobacteria bacterium]